MMNTEERQKERRKKIDWFKQYIELQDYVNDQEEEKEFLEAMKCRVTPTLSHTPRGGTPFGLVEIMTRIDEINGEISKRSLELVEKRNTVKKAIYAFSDYNVFRVFKYRYIKKMGWNEICAKLYVSWDTAHRWHRKGLDFVQLENLI